MARKTPINPGVDEPKVDALNFKTFKNYWDISFNRASYSGDVDNLKELENIIYGGHIPIFCQDYDFKNDVYVRNMNPQI